MFPLLYSLGALFTFFTIVLINYKVKLIRQHHTNDVECTTIMMLILMAMLLLWPITLIIVAVTAICILLRNHLLPE